MIFCPWGLSSRSMTVLEDPILGTYRDIARLSKSGCVSNWLHRRNSRKKLHSCNMQPCNQPREYQTQVQRAVNEATGTWRCISPCSPLSAAFVSTFPVWQRVAFHVATLSNRNCLGTWLTTAALSLTLAQEDCAWRTLICYSSVERAPTLGQLDFESETICRLTSDSQTCHTADLDSLWRLVIFGQWETRLN